MLEVVRRWYSKIPPAERDLPLVVYQGRAYSPNEVLREVQRGTALGRALQRLIELGRFSMNTRETLRKLAKLRLLRILKSLPPEYSFAAVGGRMVSRDEAIRLVMEERDFGEELIEEEMRIIQERMRVV